MKKTVKDPWNEGGRHDSFISKDMIKTSPYPKDFIPEGAVPIVNYDPACEDGDCTVKGFYKDGKYHIQEVIYRKPDQGR